MTPRSCRVCGCTDARACPGGCFWLDPREDLCSECVAARPHVVRRGHLVAGYRGKRTIATSIATCSCGTFSAELPCRHHLKLDRLVRDHWREVVALAGGGRV